MHDSGSYLNTWPTVSSLKSSHALSCAQIWCAAGVNLSGGRLPGDAAAAASSDEKAKSADPSPEGTDDASSTVEDDPVEKLDKELSEGRRLVREAELEEEKERSSHVWICTSTQAISKVTVIDANSPADVLETFQVSQNFQMLSLFYVCKFGAQGFNRHSLNGYLNFSLKKRH